MEYKNIKGIIVRETKYKEADKIFTVVTDALGKISVMAKGVSKLSSKNFGLSSLALCEMDLKELSDGFYVVTSYTKAIDFFEITKDLENHCYVNYILNLANDLFLEGDPFPELFKLLINTVYLYMTGKKNKELLKCIFELRALTLSGYAIDIDGCAYCGEEKTEYINLYEGVCFCEKCGNDDMGRKIPPSVMTAVKHITYCDESKLFSFTMGDNLIRELSIITTNYIKICLEKEYSSLKYLRSIQKGMK